MTDPTLPDIYRRLNEHPDADAIPRLIEAAACVANAIQVGAGSMIQGSLMQCDATRTD